MKHKIIIDGIDSPDMETCDWYADFDDIMAVTMLQEENSAGSEITLGNSTTTLFSGQPALITDLKGSDYDYIVMVDNTSFVSRRTMLTSLGFPRERLIRYPHYALHHRGLPFHTAGLEFAILAMLKKHHVHSLLDRDLFFIAGKRFSNTHRAMEEMGEFHCDAVNENGDGIWPIYGNIYDNAFPSLKDVGLRHYDALLLAGGADWNDCLDKVTATLDMADVFITWTKDMPSPGEMDEKRLTELGLEECSYMPVDGLMLLGFAKKRPETKIYVVAHKDYNIPQRDSIFVTINVGSRKGNGVYDNTGDNIATLNPFINEMTAIYWVWKNTNHDIVGFEHYHRFFQHPHKKRFLTDDLVQDLLKKYDILLLDEVNFDMTDEQSLLLGSGPAMYNLGREIMRFIIEHAQPDYLDAFDYALSSAGMYRCNMFITRRHVFNAFAEWAFSILLPAVENFKSIIAEQEAAGKTYLPPEKRILGFFAERLLTIWLLGQNLRLKELPVREFDKNAK